MNAIRHNSRSFATPFSPKLMTGEIDVSELDLKQLNSHLGEC